MTGATESGRPDGDILAATPASERGGMPTAARWHHRAAAWAAAGSTLVLLVAVVGILATLPVSVASILDDVLVDGDSAVYAVVPAGAGAAETAGIALDIAVVTLDELTRSATLRVSARRRCAPDCLAEVVDFYSLGGPGERVGTPPVASVALPPTRGDVTQNITVPIQGHPVRYPFDVYRLRLGLVFQRVGADGVLSAIDAPAGAAPIAVTVQEQLPRQRMAAPVAVDPAPATAAEPGRPAYRAAFELAFARPLYLPVLAVLLVVLISLTAAYAVLVRPLRDFFVNFGGVVLGIWSVRSILVPATAAFVTAVDLALSMVILFLLGAIVVRSLLIAHHRSGLPPTRMRSWVDSFDELRARE